MEIIRARPVDLEGSLRRTLEIERDQRRQRLKDDIETARRRLDAVKGSEKDSVNAITWHQSRLDFLRSRIVEIEQDHAQARQRLAEHVREGMEALRRNSK